MARYLEYDITTGRIISEVIADSRPEMSGSCELLEIPDNLEINTMLYAVRDGQLVKIYETNEERLERERFKREQSEQIRQRMKAIREEFITAQLEDDYEAVENLKAEYKSLRGYL